MLLTVVMETDLMNHGLEDICLRLLEAEPALYQ